jgi:23S rRNA (adenine2030-N6)-methyltransferase
LNYRHAYHAGNFADLVKHAALIDLVRRMAGEGEGLTVIDTHAGAGLYDLEGPEAAKSGEAAAGIGRLLDAANAPPALQALVGAVRAARKASGLATAYPGSPWLVAERLGARDRLVACELRGEEHAALQALMRGRAQVETRCADGFAAAAAATPAKGPALVVIDPPFERADDYRSCVAATRAVLGRNRRAVVLIWLPLKDLETFDAFLRELEPAVGRTPLTVAETRMRPLTDPMRMNGCVLVLANAPSGFEPVLSEVCGWVAGQGEGGGARIWNPGAGA